MMAAVLGVTLSYSQNESEKQLAISERIMIQLLADLSRIALLTSEYDELQPYIEQVVKDPHIESVLLADRRGRVVVSSKHSYIGGTIPDFNNTDTLRWMSREISNSNGRIGNIAIRFSHKNLAQINREVLNLGISVALFGMTTIAFVGVLIGFLLTRRLGMLSGAAQRLAGGDLAVRAGLSGDDEVAIVGQAFDSMARSIAENVEALRHSADLLEQRVAERTRELAEARDEAIGANRGKSVFLANMSHEIRTPLAAIIGFSETLLLPNQTMSERVDAIRTIVRSGNHLLRIINDILDVSKIEAEKIDVEHIPVNLFEAIDDVEAIVSPLALEKNLRFDVDYQFPLPTQITSDPLRLKQILINLCNNAIKFTRHGGVRIEVICAPLAQRLTFKIIDTGIGLTEAQISSVFSAFTQADASTTRQFGGTGLGLYLSQQLAAMLGGNITVQSTPEAGSCFTVTVATGALNEVTFVSQRRVQEHAEAETSPREVSVRGDVLLAEDNIDNQKLIALFLRRSGARTDLAENGQRAVELAMQHEYDLILMDLQMPVMGGVEAVRTLRQRGYRGAIVALTANAMKSDIETCAQVGCNELVAKPIQQDKLSRLLVHYLRPVASAPSEDGPIASTLLAEEPTLIDLVTEFVGRLPSSVQAIREAHDARDAASLKTRVHTLKGSSGNFGYTELFKLCQVIEFEIAKANESGIAKLLGDLNGMVARIAAGLPANTPPILRNAKDA